MFGKSGREGYWSLSSFTFPSFHNVQALNETASLSIVRCGNHSYNMTPLTAANLKNNTALAWCLLGSRQWSRHTFRPSKTMLRFFHTISLVTTCHPKTQRKCITPSFLLVFQVHIFHYLCQLKFCILPYCNTVLSCILFDRSGHMTVGTTDIITFNYATWI